MVIRRCVPLPQPDPRELAVELEGRADEVDLEIFSANMVLVQKVQAGPQTAGWCRVALPSTGLVNGTYFYRVQARRGAAKAAESKGSLIRIH